MTAEQVPSTGDAVIGLVLAAVWWTAWTAVAARRARRRDHTLGWVMAYEIVVVPAAAVVLVLAVAGVGPLTVPDVVVGRLRPATAVLVGPGLGAAWWLVLRLAAPRVPHVGRPLRRRIVHAVVLGGDAAAEEVLHRGCVLLGLLGLGLAPVPAVLLGAALFGATHLPFGLGSAVVHTGTGVILGGAVVVTGGLAVPVLAHVAFNVGTALADRTPSPAPVPATAPGAAGR